MTTYTPDSVKTVIDYNREIFDNSAHLIKTSDIKRSMLCQFDETHRTLLDDTLDLIYCFISIINKIFSDTIILYRATKLS